MCRVLKFLWSVGNRNFVILALIVVEKRSCFPFLILETNLRRFGSKAWSYGFGIAAKTFSMWRDILNDQPFLNEVAKLWIPRLAAGYPPSQLSRSSGRRTLDSAVQSPKLEPGIRPINVPVVWRRLAATGPLTATASRN
jgi:hypothetical protein